MSILSCFSDWLGQCPQLAGRRINANYLDADAPCWALVEAPVTPVLSQYADGTCLKQKSLALTAVQDYSPDVLVQLEETGVWESVGEWVQAQNRRRRNLPVLDAGCTCRKVEVSATHAVIQSSAQTARFQIQFMITYEQKG